MIYNVFTEMCKHDLILEHSPHPKKKPCTYQQSLPIPSPPPSPGNQESTFHLYVFPVVGISYT